MEKGFLDAALNNTAEPKELGCYTDTLRVCLNASYEMLLKINKCYNPNALLLRAGLALVGALVFTYPVCASLSWSVDQLDLPAQVLDRSLTAEFPFTNKTAVPVTITEVISSCGCTTAEVGERTLAPGKGGIIKAVFDIGDRVGPQEKKITVKTDDGKVQVLSIKTIIPELLTLKPRLVLWSRGAATEAKTVEVAMHPDAKATVTVLEISPSGAFTAEWEDTDAAGNRTLMLSPRSIATRLSGKIVLGVRLPGEVEPRRYSVFVYVK